MTFVLWVPLSIPATIGPTNEENVRVDPMKVDIINDGGLYRTFQFFDSHFFKELETDFRVSALAKPI